MKGRLYVTRPDGAGNYYYNRACVFALRGQVLEALPPLRQAFELDQIVRSTEHLELAQTDSDFALVRHEAAFQALLAECAGK